ncbi:MAG: hydroxylamine reductase, partial [Prolixibacteraceae bacterium]
MSMFCFQCQEAAKGVGCTVKGVCGKTDDVANLQDTLLFILRGISWYNEKLRAKSLNTEKTDKFVFDGLFSTITNANFDKNNFEKRIINALALRNELHQECVKNNIALPEELPDFATWEAATVE